MYKKLLLIYIFFICGCSQNSILKRNPTEFLPEIGLMQDDVYGRSNSMYGTLASSEAEGLFANSISCKAAQGGTNSDLEYFKTKFLDKILEFKTLENLAINENEVLKTPSCLKKIDVKDKSFQIREEWMKAQLEPNRIFRSFVLYLYFKNALATEFSYCSLAGSLQNHHECVDLNKYLNKIELSNYYIFENPNTVKQVLDYVNKIIAANGVSVRSIPTDASGLDTLQRQVIYQILSIVEKNNSSDVSTFFNEFVEYIYDVQQKHSQAFDNDVSDICNAELKVLIRKHKLAFRQTLSDILTTDSIFGLNKAMRGVCLINDFANERAKNDASKCIGVKQSSNVFNVNKLQYTWPRASYVNYTLIKNNNNDIEVRFNPTFQVGVGVTQSDVLQKVNDLMRLVNEEYNKTANENQNFVKVKFNINPIFDFENKIKDELKVIKIHQCFGSYLSASDRTDCSSLMSWGGERVNQPNANNYNLDISPLTVVHEFGHSMSLPDEYDTFSTGIAYLNNDNGENNSVMFDSKPENKPKLYYRHIYQIIEPALVCDSK